MPRSPRFTRLLRAACAGGGVLALGAAAAGAEPPPDFARDIRPILAQHCYDCHGLEKGKGGLQLTSRELALHGGESGAPVLVPGDSARSGLYRRLVTADADDAMPQKAERLPAAKIALLKRWIDAGAEWPDDLKHWAYVKPERPAVPTIENPHSKIENPIDAFVAARLAREGLTAAPPADPARWLRRVSLDLVGLPPTPAEVDAFVADRSPQAKERVVDRLLASPHYGERWARPWLDLARYADSHGFQRDDLRDLWPYRDWVVRALNADMPFDRFTIWQLAGDLLPENRDPQGPARNPDALVATGFHRAAPTNVEAGTDQEEGRVNQLFDRVNTTAAVWLGSTLECAQCHNHKYDPFTQRDYYRLFAYFNGTPQETAFASAKATATLKFTGPYFDLPDPEKDTLRPAAEAELARLDAALAARKTVVAAALPAAAPAAAAADGDDEEDEAAAEARRARARTKSPLDLALDRDAETRTLRAERARAQQAVDRLRPARTLVMRELPEPRPSFLLDRGNFLAPKEPVKPGTPAVLHPPGAADGGTRLDLARWLVSPENPLVARVTVNRWWAEFFGRGLVGTPEDFGVKGEAPTHPDLLDWLAVEFMASGWSMKHIHRLIALSATYGQESRFTPELLARDDRNLLLARGPRFRLDAETVRDNALAIAGLLSPKLGGPPVYPYQPPGLWESKVGGDRVTYKASAGEDAWRRGLYTVWKRSSPYPSFMAFDAAARTACTVQRSRSNTPLQALTLLNDRVYVEAALALARRVWRELPAASAPERLRHAFRLCVARAPTAAETDALAALLAAQTEVYRGEPAAAAALLGKFAAPPDADPAEFAAWHAVTTALLNLDETITKG